MAEAPGKSPAGSGLSGCHVWDTFVLPGCFDTWKTPADFFFPMNNCLRKIDPVPDARRVMIHPKPARLLGCSPGWRKSCLI